MIVSYLSGMIFMIRPFSCECGFVPSKGPSVGVWYCPQCKTPLIIGSKTQVTSKRRKEARKVDRVLGFFSEEKNGSPSWKPQSFYCKNESVKEKNKLDHHSQEGVNSSKRESEC